MQELSRPQSSLFSHAIGTLGTIGRGGGLGVVVVVGRGVVSINGGSPGGPETPSGEIGESGGRGVVTPSGPRGGVGGSKSIAEHLIVGLPVVPGGQVHTGR